MTGLLVAMASGGAVVLAVALIAAIAIPRMRSSRIDPNVDPEMFTAGQDIHAQIDKGRGGW